MQSVGARLQANIDLESGLPSKLCLWILLNIEFLDGVDRQESPGISGEPISVNDLLALIPLIVVQAIDNEKIVSGT